jgi:hypothetical protein
MKHFAADMGVPRSFRTDKGGDYINSTFVDYCNGLGIYHELTAPYTPQQSCPEESELLWYYDSRASCVYIPAVLVYTTN